MTIVTFFILLFSAVAIGVFAVVFGGTLFLSLPLFQILFPELSLASMIGSIKVGSVFRNASALWSRSKEIDWRSLWLLLPLGSGSVAGALVVSSMTEVVVPIMLLIGFFLSEKAHTITIKDSAYFVVAFIVGFYGGIFGAGILLLLLALLQLRLGSLVNARTNAILLEMCLSLIAVAVFITQGIINWQIASVWAAGGIVGGYLGGMIIGYTGTLPKQQQQWLVRIAFLLALAIALWKLTTI